MLRDYQKSAFDAVLAAHQTHQSVLGRGATGLGKAVILAHLAEHYSGLGRVLVLVDVKKLVRQLASTIKWVTGLLPGIEMADEKAFHGGAFHAADKIIVSTVQTQYSGEEGAERFRSFDPSEFSAILLDECELFLAPKAKSVVDYYLAGNPSMRCFGTSATPMRTDGVAMAELFQHLAFDLDIVWGINNGWLVPARQAFVQVSVDFSSLEISKTADGESDYSAEDIAARIANEQTMVELAKGVIHVAEDRKSIVVCPTVESARAVAHYLEGERPGCSRCIYGELGDEEKDEIFDGHQRGDFQFLTSVMMLTKGYDDPSIRAVFNCRKTKSKRLYQQVLGRGTRPLREIVESLHAAADAVGRRSVISASDKNDMLMANMVGIDDRVRDITLVDILGTAAAPEIIGRAKELQEEGMEPEDALAQAEIDVAAEQEAARIAAEAEAERLDRFDAARQQRMAVHVDAAVSVEYRDDLSSGGGEWQQNSSPIPQNQMNILRKAKISEAQISGLTPQAASDLIREIVRRWKLKLCSYKQAQLLRRCGYSREEVHDMSFERAGECITELKACGWKRPKMAGAQ